MNNALDVTDNLFYGREGLDRKKTEDAAMRGLADADDGDVFLERAETRGMSWEDGGKKTSVSESVSEGVGVRYITGNSVAFSSAKLNQGDLDGAIATARAVRTQPAGTIHTAPPPRIVTPQQAGILLYGDTNPMRDYTAQQKKNLMNDIDQYVRGLDRRIENVMISIGESFQAVQILRADGLKAADLRPMSRLSITVFSNENGRREMGSASLGGRHGLSKFFNESEWKRAAEIAAKTALTNLESVDIEPGVMTVVLGQGWPGVLLHEAVGHGLEADFNRKRTSAFSNRIGQRVAAPGVTVIDDGTLPNERGSLNIDDEGTKSKRNILIEDGILRGYMSDRFNARLMGMTPSGNGRRQDYASPTIPRMTNTFMLGGEHDPRDIIRSVKYGLYATQFNGGQVDITTGRFVFGMQEAFLIENGQITAPVKSATLIGVGDKTMCKVSMIGNDPALGGAGTCGKSGQSVPVGIGLPTLRIDGITVGGKKKAGPVPG